RRTPHRGGLGPGAVSASGVHRCGSGLEPSDIMRTAASCLQAIYPHQTGPSHHPPNRTTLTDDGGSPRSLNPRRRTNFGMFPEITAVPRAPPFRATPPARTLPNGGASTAPRAPPCPAAGDGLEPARAWSAHSPSGERASPWLALR